MARLAVCTSNKGRGSIAKVIDANSKVIESIVFSEFCAVFNARDMSLASFQSYWRMLSNRIVILLYLWWLNSAR